MQELRQLLMQKQPGMGNSVSKEERLYGQSLGYDSLGFCCLEITNVHHKSKKDSNIKDKLDYCDQELQFFHTSIVGSLAFAICIVSDANNCKLLQLWTNNH